MPRTSHPVIGWTAAIGSAAAFGASGAFARPMLDAGWTSAAVVAVRIGLASLVLAVPAAIAMRGRWRTLPAQLPWLLGYGVFAAAAVQVAFFNAVQSIPVAIALLMEYLGVIWVVLWDWLRTRHRPGLATISGMAVALLGLLVVINPLAELLLDPAGVAWGLLAGLGLAVYFVISAEHQGLPSVAFVSFGLGIGTLALVIFGVLGLVPFASSTAPVELLGSPVAWWVPAAVLALLAAALAYWLGFLGAQFLGPTRASFVGLTEVLFAVLWAWWILVEVPTPLQALGGVVLLGGVALVQWGKARDAQRAGESEVAVDHA